MAELNPYAPPRAAVEDVPDAAGDIAAFPRFSAWWVFLLACVTLSIYIPYWLYKRSKILARVNPEDAVAPGLIFAALALYVIGFLLGLGEGAAPANAGLKTISSLVSLVSNIMLLVWIFSLRNRLNRLLGASPGDGRWLSGILTFFFSIIYMQYKINQAIDAGERTAQAAATDPARA